LTEARDTAIMEFHLLRAHPKTRLVARAGRRPRDKEAEPKGTEAALRAPSIERSTGAFSQSPARALGDGAPVEYLSAS
jgi:hypothetical protein